MFKKKKPEKILDIPYHSQNENAVLREWHDRSCAIACVKMILDSFTDEDISMFDLIHEGLAINAHTEHGWSHDGIVRILRNHRVLAYSQEFKSVKINVTESGVSFSKSEHQDELRENGILKMLEEIQKGNPVICSVEAGFSDNKTSHTILIKGFRIDGENRSFIYHDPDSRNGEIKDNIEVEIERFLKYWKGLSIFVNKVE